VEQEAQVDAEPKWLSRFPAVMVLTFAFWTVFAAVFALIVHGKTRKNKSGLLSSTNGGDYQRHDDSGAMT